MEIQLRLFAMYDASRKVTLRLLNWDDGCV